MHPSIICSILATLAAISFADDSDKRAPSGFLGMRGKKLLPEGLPQESENSVEKREFEQNGDSDLYSPMYKKAPSMGFQGVRGKKDMEEVDADSGLDKRAPKGFLGMRGKKEDFYDDYYRIPVGLVGMGIQRPDFVSVEEKRAPALGFFGTRGKKQPSRSAFFGMRGKKYPYEFRGKFVGVRGKKQSEIDDNTIPFDYISENENLDDLANELDLNQLMLLLTEDNGLNWNKRRGPNGFLGMRG